MSQLKCMSFNLRVDNAGDGINAFSNRYRRAVEMIEQENPDIIGFQEVTEGMRRRLKDLLPAYTFQGCGREKNYHGESMLIAYRTSDVELISLENIWLSPTPHIPGSLFGGDQSGCPRMFTAALLKHDLVEKPFLFVNTHLDHVGKNARFLGAMQIVQHLEGKPFPFIMTGDFNATPDAPEIRLVTEALALRGVTDCTAGLGGTFHGFGKLLPDETIKIDYIFTDGVCEGSYAVQDIPIGGQYYSDHFAVCAMITL